MVLALDASMSGIGRRAAQFSPLRLLLLKTAIPPTASCVHEMDTFCKLAGAVGIELLNKLIKSHVFTVLPTASQANWS